MPRSPCPIDLDVFAISGPQLRSFLPSTSSLSLAFIYHPEYLKVALVRGSHFEEITPSYDSGAAVIDLNDLGFSSHAPLVYCWLKKWNEGLAFMPDAAASSRPRLGLCLRGWHHGKWHDGPIFHQSPEGLLKSFLPGGINGFFKLPLLSNSKGGMTWNEMKEILPSSNELLRQSLVEAMGTWDGLNLAADSEIKIHIDQLTPMNAAKLCLLRSALIRWEIAASHPQPLPSAWKRLMQNLGIRIIQATEEIKIEGQVNLEGIPLDLDSGQVSQLIEAINRRGAIIPEKILV